MADIERTLSIIKPDATAVPGAAGEILARFERAGLRIVAMKRIQSSPA
jgi:nucleoside-diphosphate kinase